MSEPQQGGPAIDAGPAPVGGAARATAYGTAGPQATVDDAPVTGDDAVDEALRRLSDLAGQDLRQQVAVFEDVHGALQDRLADSEG
ncbi:hypothetical protein [Cellulomonas phragmiteti]|uniref:Uncharacterized protein n=1 Tax=Cellulomonas phragmiteti TaxID=478780 RepID=A0ABQ4DNN8_9CELL|nr:hypothetical protein [Cellulomonas phragmiteti]GIG40962.1 hypothetical protein Cph01nite_27240 [Cellulomonas phragmiteti]